MKRYDTSEATASTGYNRPFGFGSAFMRWGSLGFASLFLVAAAWMVYDATFGFKTLHYLALGLYFLWLFRSQQLFHQINRMPDGKLDMLFLVNFLGVGSAYAWLVPWLDRSLSGIAHGVALAVIGLLAVGFYLWLLVGFMKFAAKLSDRRSKTI